MYELSRFMLMLTVLVFGYCVILMATILPQELLLVGGFLAAGAYVRKRRQLHAFGTARWASASDLKHMLDTGDGLIIGTIKDTGSRWAAAKALFNPFKRSGTVCRDFLAVFRLWRRKRLVRLTKAVHTAIFAPTGVGKGVSFVIPYLLT